MGCIDDHFQVLPQWRLPVHFAAALLVLTALGEASPLPVLGFELDLGLFTTAILGLFIVWLLNLYNFMDGIDVIAGVEAVTVAASAAMLLWFAGAVQFAMPAAVLAAVESGVSSMELAAR